MLAELTLEEEGGGKKNLGVDEREDGAPTHSKSACAPRRAAAHLAHVRQYGRRLAVAKRHVYEAVVRHRAHGRDGRSLLPAAHRSRRHKEAGVLAIVRARHPLPARVVPEGLPLRREVAEARRDAEEEGVVLLEDLRRHLGNGRALLRRVH